MVPYYIQIVQAPKQVVILHEYLSLNRIILLDGGRASLVQTVDHPRPRRRGDAALAEIEGRILARLMQRGGR